MEWLNALRGTTVGLDTAPLLYFIEKHPKYLPLLLPFFEAADRGEHPDCHLNSDPHRSSCAPISEGKPKFGERYLRELLHARKSGDTLSIAGEGALFT
jgi:hypothetical protein